MTDVFCRTKATISTGFAEDAAVLVAKRQIPSASVAMLAPRGFREVLTAPECPAPARSLSQDTTSNISEMSSNESAHGAQKGEVISRRMKICADELAPESAVNDKDQFKIPTITQNPTQQYFPASPYSAYRSDPLATDKPGDELLPEAAVWTIYKKEATEYDSELVKGRDENLNTMLLFAALFSAILTAFLIESTSLLQQDPADTSAALLLLLVQSNLGAMNVSSTPPGSSSFTPESSARWVNRLWFAAFSLSLAATLLAMLAKEWLDAFTTSHKRAPHAYAISRQARLDGFEAWGAPHIMDLLPTLLHLSLLLFALGLVVYLWRLDQAIAIMLSFIIGLTSLLYLGTVVCGAVYEFCPFITRLSRYLKLIIQVISRVSAQDCDEEEHLCQENPSSSGELAAADIRALTWLAGHARDQESGDSAYQALAGLRKRKAKTLLPARTTKQESQKLLTEAGEVAHFLKAYAARFQSTLTESPQELSKYKGENIIRYAQALPESVSWMNDCLGDLDPLLDQRGCGHALVQLGHTADRVTDVGLKVLDKIWSGQLQCTLSASTYAYVAASELRWIQAMIKNKIAHSSRGALFSGQVPATCNESLVIGIDGRRSISPAQLWTRYYATLACTQLLIDFHLEPNSRVYPMKPHALLDLLEGVTTTTAFMLELSTPYSRSSHNNNDNYAIRADVHLSGSKTYIFGGGFGPIWPLDGLLALSSGPELPLDVRHASARAMYPIAVLKAQDEVHRNQLYLGDPNSYEGECFVAKAVVNLAVSLASSDPSSWLLGRALSSLLDVIKNMDSNSSKKIPDILERDLTSMMQLEEESMSSWPEDARTSLIKVLAFELPDRSCTPHKTITVLAVMFNSSVKREYSDSGFQKLVSGLLSIIQQTPNCLSEVDTLLSELIERLDDFDRVATDGSRYPEKAVDNPYVVFFTETAGFNELAKVGQHADYMPLAAQTVIRLCISSHFQQVKAINLRKILMAKFQRVHFDDILDSGEVEQLFQEYEASPLVPRPPTISPVALSGFLDALTLALDYIQSNELEDPTNVPKFVECAMKLLNVSLIASHGEFDEDCGLKAGKVTRRLCEHDITKLDEEAVDVIARYCELPMQTDEEVATPEDQSLSRTSELNSFRAPMVE